MAVRPALRVAEHHQQPFLVARPAAQAAEPLASEAAAVPLGLNWLNQAVEDGWQSVEVEPVDDLAVIVGYRLVLCYRLAAGDWPAQVAVQEPAKFSSVAKVPHIQCPGEMDLSWNYRALASHLGHLRHQAQNTRCPVFVAHQVRFVEERHRSTAGGSLVVRIAYAGLVHDLQALRHQDW